MNAQLTVVLADIHYPVHDVPAIEAVLDFIRKNKNAIKAVVLLGDALDYQNVSRHTINKPRLRERGGLKKDIDGFARDILTPIERAVKKGTQLHYLSGNHERWNDDDLLDSSPELEGILDTPVLLKLKERGWKWYPCGGHIMVGKVLLLHGDQIGSGTHVAKKLVQSVCETAIMGHVHTFSAFTTSSQVSAKRKWIGYTLPCLCTVAPHYAKGKPNSFTNGFGLIERWEENFNIYVPMIFNGRFSYGGQLYGRGCS